MVVGALGLILYNGILGYSCVVLQRACHVFIAPLAWYCGLNFSSLAVLGVPPYPPQFLFLFLVFSLFFSFH